MAKKIIDEKVTNEALGKITRDAYLDFSNYINTSRHLVNVSDGLKVSYKRLIYSACQFPKGKILTSSTVINFVANYHPHGLSSMNEMSAVLVRSGIFKGEGSFGYKSIDGVDNPPASDRYTKIGLSDEYWELIGDLIKEVPFVESPVGAKEPTYIPLPLPACLIMKTQTSGLGVGISTVYPNFSPWSLYQAYKNNNPDLLEPGVDLILDKSKSELYDIWNKGKGKVIYSYKISRHTLDDGKIQGILFESIDGTGIFTPRIGPIERLAEEGKVFMEDLTDKESYKLFIGRIPGAKGVSIEDVELLCRRACYSNVTYLLNVTDGNTAFRIPLYSWIDYTYKTYLNLVDGVNKKKIEKCKFDIMVLESIPPITDFIMKNQEASDEVVSETLGIPLDVVKVTMSKPIGYLRKNKENKGRLKEEKDRLKMLKKFDPVLYTEEIIKRL